MSITTSLTGFNNSVIVGQSRYDVSKFTDSNALYNLYKKDTFTTYKGMIYLWNQRRLMNTPLINMTELQNNVVYVNGAEGKFQYSVPYDIGLPVIIENLTSGVQKPGVDGQKFKIKLSENCFTNTDIITYDFRDGVNLYITEDEIYQEGDGWVYTVQVVSHDRKNTWMDQNFLKPGTEYMKISNVNGEYDTQKSNIFYRTGSLDLEMQLGGHRSAFHWITAYADMLELNDNDPKYAHLKPFMNLSSPASTLVFMNKDKDGKAMPKSLKWMKRIEAMLFAEMKMMEERDLMWSQGGVVTGAGRRSVRVNTGLYHQMRNGNRVQYNTLSLSLIEQILGNLYYNSGVPIEQRKTKVQVGTAAMIEISKLLSDDFTRSNPFLVNASDVKGYLRGDAMNLGYGLRFTSKQFPVAGIVEFEINPAFDNRVNRSQDKLIGEYPKESHTLAIFDVTDERYTNAAAKTKMQDLKVEDGFNESANICLIKPKNWGDTYWGYELGTQHPFGPSATKGMFSSSQRDGYGMWMKAFSSIWLKDATRTVLMEKV